MTKYNWNYEELGFKSESEMKESIARVERKIKMDPLEYEIERRREAQSGIDERGSINFTDLIEGARLERLDSKVYQLIKHEQEQAKIQARKEEMQSMLNSFAEHIEEENEREAQREMEKEKQRLEDELQSTIYSKHNVKTDKEKQRDEALSKLLENL